MDSDIHTIEETLTQLTPQPLSAELLDQLDQAMVTAASSNSEAIIDSPEDDMETDLAELMPSALSPELFSRLDQAMAKWHEKVPVEEKVISLEELRQENGLQKPRIVSWRSGAAVAALGGAMAIFTSGTPTTPAPVPQIVSDVGPNTASNVTPISHPLQATPPRRSVVNTAERGLVWTADGNLARVLEVTVNEELEFRNEFGQTVIVTKPRKLPVLQQVD